MPTDRDWRETFYADMTADREKVALGRVYDGVLDDITRPNQPVQLVVSKNATGHVLHINIGGQCVVRVCRIDTMVIDLDRDIWKEVKNGRS